MKRSDLIQEEIAPYYFIYINKIEDTPLLELLEKQRLAMIDFYTNIPNHKLEYRYAENKWTIKEILLHIIDTERIFNYRALRIARNDKMDLLGYDENAYVPVSNANKRTIESLIQEYSILRKSTIELFKNFDDEMLMKIGTANQNKLSVRGVGFVALGHEFHHKQIIEERYL